MLLSVNGSQNKNTGVFISRISSQSHANFICCSLEVDAEFMTVLRETVKNEVEVDIGLWVFCCHLILREVVAVL